MDNTNEFTFNQWLELLIDAETDIQRTYKIEILINNAHFRKSKVSVTQIKYYAYKNLEKEQILNLTTIDFIKKYKNVRLFV